MIPAARPASGNPNPNVFLGAVDPAALRFQDMDTRGALAVNSKPAVSLPEIEVWIADLPGGKRR
jgi:hypothetical protein